MRAIFLVCFLLVYFTGFSQYQIEENLLFLQLSSNIDHERVFEAFKINSNKTFQLKKGCNVWVHCDNKKGKTKIKRSQITNISEHEITFKPYDKDFSEVTYTDNDLMYISFTSPGRIMIASVSNVIIISAAALIYMSAVLIDLFSQGHSVNSNPGFHWVPLVPFRKNIHFLETKLGEQKWRMRIVDISDTSSDL
jgi:hypothetical protein